MKKIATLALGVLTCAALMAPSFVSTAHALPVIISSDGTAADANESNTMGPTVVIPKHPGWANPYSNANGDSDWVSYGQTGDPSAPGYFVPPNGLVVSYLDSFFAGSDPFTTAWVRVMADDSTSVWLNGILLQMEAPTAGNTYGTCSDSAPGCLNSTAAVVNLLPAIVPGINNLVFMTAQRAGSSMGLNYYGEVNQVPEPASLVLVGSGVLGLIARHRRKKAALAAAA